MTIRIYCFVFDSVIALLVTAFTVIPVVPLLYIRDKHSFRDGLIEARDTLRAAWRQPFDNWRNHA